MKWIIIAATLLACAPLQAVDSGGSAPTAAERLALARDAVKANDFRKALAELRIAVREEPRNAELHNLLGYSYRKLATPDLPRAFEHYQQALKLQPTHKGAHEYIGEAYLMDKKPEMAEKHLAELEKLCGNRTCEEYADLAKALVVYRAGK
jgi:Flp pilus assembly protein TadD